MLSGSITLSGGHGTGAAYAQKFAEVQNLAGVMELALACATFGLIIGGIIGGPVAGCLILKRGLEPDDSVNEKGESMQIQEQDTSISTDTLLQTLFYVLLCLIGGRALASLMAGAAFTLPSFVWCLFIGVAIRNSGFLGPFLTVHRSTVDTIGSSPCRYF
ncbi:MAG: hypothetical protein KAG45_09630 [Methyloprofundus sp.]|nr:hypothetical protein [Methyloprofundus sp.]